MRSSWVSLCPLESIIFPDWRSPSISFFRCVSVSLANRESPFCASSASGSLAAVHNATGIFEFRRLSSVSSNFCIAPLPCPVSLWLFFIISPLHPLFCHFSYHFSTSRFHVCIDFPPFHFIFTVTSIRFPLLRSSRIFSRVSAFLPHNSKFWITSLYLIPSAICQCRSRFICLLSTGHSYSFIISIIIRFP